MSSLPLKRITMYKNDLAFVEREGQVGDHATEEQQLELSVRTKVKGLVVSTLSATTTTTTAPATASAAVTIKYDKGTTPVEEDPLFSFKYGADVNLGNLLASVIGAEIELETSSATAPTGSATAEGTVLLVEMKQQVIDGTAADPELESQWSAVQLLCSTGQIRRVLLNTVVSARLLDPALQQQLVASLKRRLASSMPKKKQPKGMTSIGIVVPPTSAAAQQGAGESGAAPTKVRSPASHIYNAPL